MNSSNDQTIRALARTVQDVNRPEGERRDALRHLAAIRGENASPVDKIPADDLVSIVAGMTAMSAIRLADLSLADVLEAIREGRARRATMVRRS